MNSPVLKNETKRYQRLREKLLGLSELDDETIRDTLEGITDLHEMIATAIRSALVDEVLHSSLRSRIEEMKERLAHLECRGLKSVSWLLRR
jgi:hypothetical protein